MLRGNMVIVFAKGRMLVVCDDLLAFVFNVWEDSEDSRALMEKQREVKR